MGAGRRPIVRREMEVLVDQQARAVAVEFDAADDLPVVAAGCELVLEALVARKKIARSDSGTYGRAVEEKRRRPYQD